MMFVLKRNNEVSNMNILTYFAKVLVCKNFWGSKSWINCWFFCMPQGKGDKINARNTQLTATFLLCFVSSLQQVLQSITHLHTLLSSLQVSHCGGWVGEGLAFGLGVVASSLAC